MLKPFFESRIVTDMALDNQGLLLSDSNSR